MFDWFRSELKIIRTPKFHQCRRDHTASHESPIDWPVEPPGDYRRFIEEFGPCGLYRLHSYWEIKVNDRPVVIDDAKQGRFLKFGGKNPGIACFKLEHITVVAEGPASGRNAGICFRKMNPLSRSTPSHQPGVRCIISASAARTAAAGRAM